MMTSDSSDAATPGPRDLTGFSPKAKAWRAFIETSAVISDRMEKRLFATTGLKLSDYNLLLLLAEAPGHQLRMGELAEKMVFSPSRLSYHVKTLAGEGLLRRSSDSADKRGMVAQLTAQGHEVFTTASAVHAEHIRQMFHPALDDEQAAALHQMCQQILATTLSVEEPC